MAGNANDWVFKIVSVVIAFAIAWMAERLTQRFTVMLAPLFRFLAPRIQPWTYESILPDDLPKRVRRYFERTSTAFVEQRFRFLEDVILQSEPRKSYARFFAAPEEECLGSVVSHGGIESFTCISLAEDGTYLETGAIDFGPLPPPESKVRLFRAPQATVASVVSHHRQQMAEFTKATGSEMVLIDPADWRTVVEHGHTLVARDMFARHLIAELPEFAREREPGPSYDLAGR